MRYWLLIIIILLPSLSFGESQETVPDPEVRAALPARAVDISSPDIVVLPETVKAIEMNNTGYNRIQCSGPIQDIVPSEEKVVTAKYLGNNAFVKFKYLVKDGKPVYVTKPVEMSIVCDGEVYTIVGVPRSLRSSPTIRLSGGGMKKIKQNASVFGGMPLIKKCVHFVKMAYTDNLPKSFDVTPLNKPMDLYKGLRLVLKTLVTVAGEGVQLKEYSVVNVSKDNIGLTEKDFLKPELTTQPLFISFGPPKFNLKPGDSIRIFIVERTGGDHE